MTEFAPPGRRGLYGAWQSFTVALGLLAGAGTSAILASVMSESALESWGWRIAFLLALPLGVIALILRSRLEETPVFQAAPPAEVAPASARETARAIALGIARLMGWSAAGYTFLVVIPSYLQSSLHATFHQALVATVVANAGFALAILPAGWLSDRIGRRWVMLTGVVLITVLALPLLNVLQDDSAGLGAKSAAVFAAGFVVGLIAGPGPAMLAEMFPTNVRYTGLGLAYSLSNAVFSGSAGLIITSLIKSTGNIDVPAYYVMATCVVSAVAIATLRTDHRDKELS
jgi:MHS family proline/betaine transporter-like MFS transporter